MKISRRDALLGASAAAVVTAAIAAPLALKAAGVKAALGGDPVTDLNDQGLLGLERQWLDHQKTCEDWPHEQGEVYESLYARLSEMEECIYCNPAQTLAGVMVKLRMWSWHCSDISQPHPYGEPWWRGDLAAMYKDEMGFAQIMRDLERLARSAPS